MRQLRPGAGESGHFLTYIVTLLCVFSTISYVESAGSRSSSRVENSNAAEPRALGTQPPKDLAVVTARRGDTDDVPGYGGIRAKGSMVGGYIGKQRSLDDYEVEDFVLMSTVNGTLSARDRKTGKERWQIHTEDAAVQTINHRSNSTEQEDAMTWIVEPSEDGKLFFYTPEGGLEKLEITVKDIIHSTPYMPPGADTVYNGAKNTTTYAINARTGVIQRVFSTGGVSGVVNDRKCKTTTKLSDMDGECDSTENADKIIMLGRTEYTIRIQRWSTAELLWTIKFNEWSPNNSDLDLRAQYQRPLDNRYIYSQHDGKIYGFDDADSTGVRPPKYHAMLESPVVRIFDVVRPLSNPASYDLLILPQPSIRTKKDEEASEGNTFVGCTQNGGWYALSETNFPYVTRQASDADCYKQGRAWKSLPAPERELSLVGIHKVHSISHQEHYQPTLPAPPPKALDGNHSPTPPQPSIHTFPPTITYNSGTLLTYLVMTLALILTLIYAAPTTVRNIVKSKTTSVLPKGFKSDYRWMFPENQPLLESIPQPSQVQGLTATVGVPEPVAVNAVEVQPEEQKPVVEEQKLPEEEMVPAAEQKLEGPKPDEGPTVGIEQADVELNADGTKAVRFQEPEINEEVRPEAGAAADGNVGVEAIPATPKKKIYKRGRRGGKKKSKDQTNQLDDGANGGPLETVAENPAAVSRGGQVTVLSTGRVEPDASGGYHILNSLEIWEDELLGTGSQGTTVHRGCWEGKAVAVKRMLTHHVDLASREVKTLQDADFHPNIVRYFCQQQQNQFLYIALELCIASAFDVVTKAEQYREYHDLLDPVDALGQMLNGLHHLHTLKIVHRDIKPQNILVAPPNPRSKRPRYLISDFGLCKKLHQDEYSFGATTTQNAGTIGWRAPELLTDCAQSLEGLSPNENSGSGSGTGTDIVVDHMTKRRATRAIDIFAMGCVFYFILTRGSHPFGHRWERELNIVKGNKLAAIERLSRDGNLEALDLIGNMLEADPKKRPDTAKVSMHPYFWDDEKRLDFLLAMSDRFELEKDKEKNSKPPGSYVSHYIPMLEHGAPRVVGPDWLQRLDPALRFELVGNPKRRGYDGAKILDLLRVIRNKKHHFLDMSPAAQQAVGEPPELFLRYFTSRFEHLLMYTYEVVMRADLDQEPRFKKFFTATF